MGLFAKKREITDNDSIQTPQEVVDLQDRLRECEEDIQEAESRLKTIRAEYNTTITNLINIKKEINEKKEEQKRLSQQNVNLQMQVEQSREILRDSYHDRTVAEKTVADLRQADTDLKAKITEYKAVERRLSDAEKRLAAMQDEIQVINKETEQGRASIERIDADIESKREVLASLKLEQNKVEQKNTKDRHAQDALNTELAHTKMQLAEAITEREGLRSELEEHKKLIHDLEKRLTERPQATSDTANSGVIKAASSLVASYKAQLAKVQERLTAKEMELEKERTLRDAKDHSKP